MTIFPRPSPEIDTALSSLPSLGPPWRKKNALTPGGSRQRPRQRRNRAESHRARHHDAVRCHASPRATLTTSTAGTDIVFSRLKTSRIATAYGPELRAELVRSERVHHLMSARRARHLSTKGSTSSPFCKLLPRDRKPLKPNPDHSRSSTDYYSMEL